MTSAARRTAVLAAILGLAGCATGGGGAGGRASGFTLPDLRGGSVTLSSYLDRHEVVLISFWATWCRPCLVELPFLNDLYQQHRGDGFAVLAVSMDGPETESQVRPVANRYRWAFPVLLDRDTQVAGLYNPRRSAPYSVLVGRDGRIVTTHEGFVAGDREEIRATIERALALPR